MIQMLSAWFSVRPGSLCVVQGAQELTAAYASPKNAVPRLFPAHEDRLPGLSQPSFFCRPFSWARLRANSCARRTSRRLRMACPPWGFRFGRWLFLRQAPFTGRVGGNASGQL